MAAATNFPSSLQSSWVLSKSSSIHVCNESMKDRFTKERDCIDGSTIEDTPILAYGTVLPVNVSAASGKGPIELKNVAYVPSFKTNLVSVKILQNKGLRLGRRCLLRDNKPLLYFTKYDGYSLLEDNSNEPTTSPPATPATSVITSPAHVAEGVEDIIEQEQVDVVKQHLVKQHQTELASLREQHQEEVDHWQQRQEAWQQRNQKLKQLHAIELRQVQAKLNQDHRNKLYKQKQTYEQKNKEIQAQIAALSPAPTP